MQKNAIITVFLAQSLFLVAQSCTSDMFDQNYSRTAISNFTGFNSGLIKETMPIDTIDCTALFMRVDSNKTYTQTKAEILKIKSKIDREIITEDSLSVLFTDLLVQKIFPYWYGTPWDFNGYTAVPNQGVIACGYFVSTTLLHMGVNINRYKMAQQLPIHEAQTVSCGHAIQEIYNETIEENIAQLDTILTEGIYFLGFDQSHVGFILKKYDRLFVIHANYIGNGGVAVEKIEESQAFASYRRFYIAEISTNKILIKKWILNEVVTVIEE